MNTDQFATPCHRLHQLRLVYIENQLPGKPGGHWKQKDLAQAEKQTGAATVTDDEPPVKDGSKLEHDEPAIVRGDPHYQGHQPGSAKQEPKIKEESLVKKSSTNPELSRTQADKEKFTSIYLFISIT